MGDMLVKGMKQAEFYSLIAPSVLVLEFYEVDQTRWESKAMSPDNEIGDGCMCSLTRC
jgi:hypothetical protein